MLILNFDFKNKEIKRSRSPPLYGGEKAMVNIGERYNRSLLNGLTIFQVLCILCYNHEPCFILDFPGINFIRYLHGV